MRYCFCLFLFLSLFLIASPAWAHRVNIFALVEGNEILVECGFNRSQKVKGGQIEVFNAASGERLLSGTTDAQGQFRFPIPPQALKAGQDLRIHINAGEGHQNDWTVAAAEFMAAPKTSAPSPQPVVSSVLSSAAPAPAVSGGNWATPADVERIVNTALDARLTPIKRILAEQVEAGPDLEDIIGGIGWIFGIVGVAAYFKRRP